MARLFLPLSTHPGALPTVDAVRKRLGGRASTEPGAGELVVLPGERVGAVIFVRGEQLDVWLEGDVVRRVRRAEARPAPGEVSPALAAAAHDARVFGALREGERVRVLQDGAQGEGTLVEKCRFGGLVERGDGTVMGVGFRRLLPLPLRLGALPD